MGRTTIDFGIDLGTTNSAIAVLEGTKAHVIKNNDGMDYTPSAIYIDKSARLMVGQLAKMRLEVEPDDSFAEFKLQMGTGTEYKFARSGRKMHAEDLSAEVLKSLRADVKQRTGEDVQAAVITVPAAFELPQCDATRRAAQLAGLQASPLIMEPTAAAMAHAFQSQVDKVFWLVYDFGGGTFDAAVIQIREGTFRIVNHAGDNHLGGKLIDWEIVEQLLAPAAAKGFDLPDFRRGNAKWRKAFAKLKLAAEEAKIRLSHEESHQILIDFLCNDNSGEQVTFDFELRRSDLQRLATPFIQRTVNISRKALADAHLGIGDIEKVILVGGPTLAPYLRDHLSDRNEGLGIRLDFSVDPLTVVAQGAAIFAGTQRLEGDGAPVPTGSYAIELEYNPVGADPEPVVGGRVVAGEGEALSGFTVEFVNPNSRPAWRSGKVGLAPNGAFMTVLWAERGRPNNFRIELSRQDGTLVPCQPESLTYTIGIAPTAPPLIHSMGVALANNEVKIFHEKGVTLPARQRKDLKTALMLHRGAADEKLKVPVIEGDNVRADRNRLIGYLEINATEIKRDVPASSDVEVTIEVDESRIVKTSAYIPLLDQEFEAVLKLAKTTPDVKALEEDLAREKQRLENARQKAEETGDPNAQRILTQRVDGERMVQNVETSLSAARGDADAGDKAQNRLLDLKIAVDEVENALEWPTLVKEAEAKLENARKIANDYGDDEGKRRFAQLEKETRAAIQGRDVDQVRRKLDELDTLAIRILVERPEFWVSFFQNLEERKSSMRDRAQADQLFAQGNRAMQNNDLPRLKAVVQQLLSLLPVDQQAEMRGGFGSGVV
jgi:molecular chaperone DnaK